MATPGNVTPVLFDRALLRTRQDRARKQGEVTFLLDRVAEDMADRISAVKRDFADVADIWTPGDVLRTPVADRFKSVARIALDGDSGVLALMRDLRQMGATNVLIERRRTPTRRATLLRMAQIYGERFADADGRIRATFDIVWLSAWAPHESQPKPLRPGSAKASLEAAVKRGK